MQLASTSTPRSATNSATCSYDSGYRRYQRTHKMITSPGCWRPLKGLFGVIGMNFYPTSVSATEVRNRTLLNLFEQPLECRILLRLIGLRAVLSLVERILF